MPLFAPDKRRGMAIPANDSIGKPLLQDFDIVGMIPLQRSPFDDPLHRFRHGEPGTRIGRGKQENPVLSTPLHDAVAFMPGQVVPDQQDSDGREKAIELVGSGIDIPVLPALTNGNRFRSSRTVFQDGGEFSLQPGMQNGIGTLLDGFGTKFSRGRPKQGEQFRGFSRGGY
jgi:hypothetical protein